MKKCKLLLLLLVLFLITGCSVPLDQTHSMQENHRLLWVQNLQSFPQEMQTTCAIEDDKEVIYISKTGIDRYDKSKKTTAVLVDDPSIFRLQKINDAIYFCNSTAVKQLNADGTISVVFDLDWLSAKERQVFPCDDISGFWFYQEDLYVKNLGTSVVKIDLETLKIEEFLPDVSAVAFFENKCYFTEHSTKNFTVYEKDLITNEMNCLIGDGLYGTEVQYDDLIVVEGELYYSRRLPSVIYRHDPSGKEVAVTEDLGWFCPIANYTYCENLFYTKRLEENRFELYKYNTVTEEHERLASSENPFLDLVITDYSIVYRDSKDASFKHLYY